jgi:hypothetical protein
MRYYWDSSHRLSLFLSCQTIELETCYITYKKKIQVMKNQHTFELSNENKVQRCGATWTVIRWTFANLIWRKKAGKVKRGFD